MRKQSIDNAVKFLETLSLPRTLWNSVFDENENPISTKESKRGKDSRSKSAGWWESSVQSIFFWRYLLE
jgi:hypothetical protein